MKKLFPLFLFCLVCLLPKFSFGQNNIVVNKPQVMPEFQGGESLSYWLQTHVSYPAEALENGEQGRVLVGFIVEADGSLSSFKIVSSVSPLLDAEAIRVAKTMPRFRPGYNDGKPCRVQYLLPVNFKLDGDDSSAQNNANSEQKVYLIEKNRVANIVLGKSVSDIPEKLEGLYDNRRIEFDDIFNVPILTLYCVEVKIMDIVCENEYKQHDVENGNISCIIAHSPNLSLANGIHPGLSMSDLIDKYHVNVSYINRGRGDFDGSFWVNDNPEKFYRLNLKGALTKEAEERFCKIMETSMRSEDGIYEMPVSSSDILEGVVESISVFYLP